MALALLWVAVSLHIFLLAVNILISVGLGFQPLQSSIKYRKKLAIYAISEFGSELLPFWVTSATISDIELDKNLTITSPLFSSLMIANFFFRFITLLIYPITLVQTSMLKGCVGDIDAVSLKFLFNSLKCLPN